MVEASARELVQAPLYEMYAETRQRMGRDVPVIIQIVRPATDGETGLQPWHDEMVARHNP